MNGGLVYPPRQTFSNGIRGHQGGFWAKRSPILMTEDLIFQVFKEGKTERPIFSRRKDQSYKNQVEGGGEYPRGVIAIKQQRVGGAEEKELNIGLDTSKEKRKRGADS